MNLSEERKALSQEAYRISGRLKIIAMFWAIGRDEAAFEMLAKEIDKVDEMCQFIEMLNHQQEVVEPNATSPVKSYH
jgi:hypothetical protein